MNQNRYVFAAIAVALFLPISVAAHHSVNAFFDLSDPITIEGRVTSARWANPHVQLQLERVGPDGETQQWVVGSGGPTLLRRLGVTADLFEIGDRIAISGFPSRREEHEMIGVSIGLSDGREMPMFPTLARRFGHEVQSGVHITADEAARGERTARGIFRVWTVGQKPDQWASEPSFTPAAISGQADYDPLTDDLALQCIPSGMPIVMDNPFPIEFTESEDAIILQLEIWDIVRTIHMNADSTSAPSEPSPLGYSTGRWENNTLVVETTDINWRYFDDDGTPQSPSISVVERFRLSEDEARLDYEAVITDPTTLTAPAVRTGHWVWVPGEALQTYACTLED